jgi:DNA-directed RNA polymerase subunit RPC12/RpoP
MQIEVGTVFGDWTVTDLDCGSQGTNTTFPVRCVCGTESYVTGTKLKSGESTRCRSCAYREMAKKRSHYSAVGAIPGFHLTKIKDRAKKRGIIVSITMQDLEDQWSIQNGRCAFTGRELTIRLSRNTPGNASLDRIDSSVGYIPENIQWLHWHANQAKNDLDESAFFNLCKEVVDYKSETKRLRGSRPWLKD